MKKIVSILLSTIIFCSLFAVPLSVGAKTINIESSTAAMDADCEDGYRFVERYEEGVTKDNWASILSKNKILILMNISFLLLSVHIKELLQQ